MALALLREQAVEYFLDSLTLPMQEVARMEESGTSTWADLALVLKRTFHSSNDLTGWRSIIGKVIQGPRTSMQFLGELMKVHREWEPHLTGEEIHQMEQACITALLHQGSKRVTKITFLFAEKNRNASWKDYVAHLLSKICQDA